MRKLIPLALLPVLLVAALPAVSSARTVKPVIKGTEVGYFGGALVTRRISVIVYSNLGPRAGNHVKVCFAGRCKRAHGHNRAHNASTAWYIASFSTRTMTMSDHVTFTAVASDSGGRAKVHATKPVLCIKNNGSTPQA